MGNSIILNYVLTVSLSGKTLAFVVPMLNKILKLGTQVRDHQVLGVIISPTQELAIQTDEVVKIFSTKIPEIKTHFLVGGKLPTFKLISYGF